MCYKICVIKKSSNEDFFSLNYSTSFFEMLVLTRTEGILPSLPVRLLIESNSPTTTILITDMF